MNRPADFRIAAAPILRRDLLHNGSLGAKLLSLGGLALPDLLRAELPAGLPNDPQIVRPARSFGTARACILFFLEGDPAHQDLWDMKPQAPLEVRGEFWPIDSSLPGVPVCEHLPLLARQIHRLALVRSVHHNVVDRNAGAYYALTGMH